MQASHIIPETQLLDTQGHREHGPEPGPLNAELLPHSLKEHLLGVKNFEASAPQSVVEKDLTSFTYSFSVACAPRIWLP